MHSDLSREATHNSKHPGFMYKKVICLGSSRDRGATLRLGGGGGMTEYWGGHNTLFLTNSI